MIFEAVNITKSYGPRVVLHDISASFDLGSITGILGPNGAGKTTFFSILIGLIPPDSGTIKLNGSTITELPMYMRAREGLIYLPQDTSIFKGLSVEDNIVSVLELHYPNKDDLRDKLENLLDAFSIAHVRTSSATSLSGGERRKVEIARALAARPRYLLLDEPFSGLDPISVLEIMDIIKNLKQKGLGIIITDHNVRETLSILDHGYIIANGNVLFKGSAEEIISNEEARKLYLGEKFKI